MKFKGYAQITETTRGPALLVDKDDRSAFDKVLGHAAKKGLRVTYTVETHTPGGRTDAQLRLYWQALTILYRAVNGTSPTEADKMALHEDIKEVYAYRRASRFNADKTVPIGLSDGDTNDAGALIDGVFQELAQLALTDSGQSDARGFWQDYWRLGGQVFKSEADFRARANLCAACGKGGLIQKAHKQSRGANHARIDDPTNWVPLCHECHRDQHQHGVPAFLRRWPHLTFVWTGEPS